MKTYEQQANKFLSATNSTLSIEYLKNDYHFIGDTDKRDVYKCELKRGQRSYVFNFGQSLSKSQHYKDTTKKGCTYTMTGKRLTGNYSINDLKKYSQWIKLVNGEAPTAYDILACLQKYDVGTFEQFCYEFGYDTDSIKANKIYTEVVNEYKSICTLYTDEEMEQLQEIQ